jgi:hypothetical protein
MGIFGGVCQKRWTIVSVDGLVRLPDGNYLAYGD